MAYLVIQMWLLLALAALLGGVVAWWLKTVAWRSQTLAYAGERDAALRELNAARATETRLASQLRLVQDAQGRVESNAVELREYRAKAAACESDLNAARAEITALRAELAGMRPSGPLGRPQSMALDIGAAGPRIVEPANAARLEAAETALAAARAETDALRLELDHARGAASALDAAHAEISRLRTSLAETGPNTNTSQASHAARTAWRLRYFEARARFLEQRLDVLTAGVVDAAAASSMHSAQIDGVPDQGALRGGPVFLAGQAAQSGVGFGATQTAASGVDPQAERIARLQAQLAEAQAEGRQAQQLRSELASLREAAASAKALAGERARLDWRARYLSARVDHLTGLHEAKAEVSETLHGAQSARDADRARIVQLEAQLAAQAGEAAELAALRARLAAAPPPLVRNEAAESALAQRVAQLEAQTRAQANDAIALSVLRARITELEHDADQPLAAFVTEPDTDSETARLRWRNRYLDARVRYLEGRLESEAAALGATGRVTTMTDLAPDQAAAARDLAELDRLRARLAEVNAGGALAGAIDDEEMARLKWRVKYLEGRVRYLETMPPPPSFEPPQPAPPPPVVTPAPRPLPRTGPIMRAAPDAYEDYPDDGLTLVREPEEERPPTLDAPRAGEPDDLKMIGGIGPKIESTLNTLGIYHFDQIAAWTASHTAWVEGYISFKGRVVREKWVEQARILARGGTTEAAEKYKRGEHS